MAQAAAGHAVEHHSATGTDNRKLLMWVFLGSECLFFGSLIATYLIFNGRMLIPPFPHDRVLELADAAAASSFVEALPHGVGEACTAVGRTVECGGILDILVTSQSTFVLLMSSVAMVLAVYAAQHNRPTMLRLWLLATVVLGLIFLGYQVFEFTTFGQEGLNLARNQFGASFFFLTGFHGTHVAIGVIYLFSMFMASFRRNGLGPDAGVHVEIAGLYWHFVDIVWIIIFTVIYLIPS